MPRSSRDNHSPDSCQSQRLRRPDAAGQDKKLRSEVVRAASGGGRAGCGSGCVGGRVWRVYFRDWRTALRVEQSVLLWLDYFLRELIDHGVLKILRAERVRD